MAGPRAARKTPKVERLIFGLTVLEFTKQAEQRLVGRLAQVLLVGTSGEWARLEPHPPWVISAQPRARRRANAGIADFVVRPSPPLARGNV